jgi:hypothetical protein
VRTLAPLLLPALAYEETCAWAERAWHLHMDGHPQALRDELPALVRAADEALLRNAFPLPEYAPPPRS